MYSPNAEGALNLKNVIWLLITMALVIAPHALRLPVWITVACVAAGLARWHIARKGLRAPNPWVMAAIAIGIVQEPGFNIVHFLAAK